MQMPVRFGATYLFKHVPHAKDFSSDPAQVKALQEKVDEAMADQKTYHNEQAQVQVRFYEYNDSRDEMVVSTNTDNYSASDVLNLTILDKVMEAYADFVAALPDVTIDTEGGKDGLLRLLKDNVTELFRDHASRIDSDVDTRENRN